MAFFFLQKQLNQAHNTMLPYQWRKYRTHDEIPFCDEKREPKICEVFSFNFRTLQMNSTIIA